MKSIHRWSASLAVVAVIGLSSPAALGQANPASVQGLGGKIAGTYLALARPAGLEPATSWFVARRSIQLS